MNVGLVYSGFTKIIHLVEHMFRETIASSFAGELRNFYEYCQFQKSILIIISSRFILNPYQDNLEKNVVSSHICNIRFYAIFSIKISLTLGQREVSEGFDLCYDV